MKINYYAFYKTEFFRLNVSSSLTPQQKKTLLIATVAFVILVACFAALNSLRKSYKTYLVNRKKNEDACHHIDKLCERIDMLAYLVNGTPLGLYTQQTATKEVLGEKNYEKKKIKFAILINNSTPTKLNTEMSKEKDPVYLECAKLDISKPV